MPIRPCWVEISTDSLQHNYRSLVDVCRGASSKSPSNPPVEVLAIVKADAYGHGLDLCAPAVLEAGARWLGVTSVEEGTAARALTHNFPDTEILIIGGPFPGQGTAVIQHRLTAVVWEPWQLEELQSAATASNSAASLIPVHLELDTGMSRQGVSEDRLDEILQKFKASASALRLDGLMTHLYAADESDGVATREQFAQLERMMQRIHATGLEPKWLHVGNSAAVLGGEVAETLQTLAAKFESRPMIRPGLSLYGLVPEILPDVLEAGGQLQPCGVSAQPLQRVLQWKTRVVSLRSIAPGQGVGYNATFVATEPMQIALLAVGYADGLKRSTSGSGYVLVKGQRAPIIGRISMDQTVVDVTEIPGVAPGDEVVLLGRQGTEAIHAEDHAAWAGTIPWEIFTSIGKRVPRQKASQ
jgi:alanine racemase